MNSVSVIIPTLNGEKTLPYLLKRLYTQTLKPAEVIVVDSASEDRTRRILEDFGIKPLIIKKEDFNHGTTRNMAARLARGDILVFMTQDAIPADNRTIETLIKPLGDEIVASYGRQIPSPDANILERFSRGFNYPPEIMQKSKKDMPVLGIKAIFFSNVCSAIKKDVFFEVGMFPEDVPLNEDMLFAYKVIEKGYRIIYQAESRLFHTHDYSLFQRFIRDFKIGFILNRSGLLEVVSPANEGFKYLKSGVSFFLEEKKAYLLGNFFLDTMLRYLAYSLGKFYGFAYKKFYSRGKEELYKGE